MHLSRRRLPFNATTRRSMAAVGLLFPLAFLMIAALGPLFGASASGLKTRKQAIRLIVDKFSRRLGISQKISVVLVPHNPRLASVEPLDTKGDAFVMSFEAAFLQTLDQQELRAAVAHELGHVWIFTHFPYLQTEALANQQALKLVRRQDLERVYQKVWRRKGQHGSLASVLGSPPAVQKPVKAAPRALENGLTSDHH